MASSNEFKDFVLEQLNLIENISYKPMMGEFLLYSNGVLFGGVYDDRFLIKSTATNQQSNLKFDIPYEGSKPMLLVEDLDDKQKLKEIVLKTLKGLKK